MKVQEVLRGATYFGRVTREEQHIVDKGDDNNACTIIAQVYVLTV